jgi:hypothetical protein
VLALGSPALRIGGLPHTTLPQVTKVLALEDGLLLHHVLCAHWTRVSSSKSRRGSPPRAAGDRPIHQPETPRSNPPFAMEPTWRGTPGAYIYPASPPAFPVTFSTSAFSALHSQTRSLIFSVRDPTSRCSMICISAHICEQCRTPHYNIKS